MRALICTLAVLGLLTPPATAVPVVSAEQLSSGEAERPEIVNSVYREDDNIKAQHAVARDKDMSDVQLQKIYDEKRAESATNPKPDIPIKNVTDDEIRERGKDFDVVAVINKAADVQKMTVWRFKLGADGRRVGHKEAEFPISTGREIWKCEDVTVDGKVVGKEPRWTGTPTGYFRPTLLDADHHSGQYDDARMYKSVIFNEKLGIATHQASTKAFEASLGKRASHGCVRLSDKNSETLFKWVVQSGGDDLHNVRTGGVCPGQNEMSESEKEACKLEAKGRSQNWKAMVSSAVTEGHADGYGPYTAKEPIPEINQDGTTKRGPGKTDGFRSLFIVQCIDKKLGNDCGVKTIPPKRTDCGPTPIAPASQPQLAKAPAKAAPATAANVEPPIKLVGASTEQASTLPPPTTKSTLPPPTVVRSTLPPPTRTIVPQSTVAPSSLPAPLAGAKNLLQTIFGGNR